MNVRKKWLIGLSVSCGVLIAGYALSGSSLLAIPLIALFVLLLNILIEPLFKKG